MRAKAVELQGVVPERRECLLSALAGYLSFFIRGGIATPGLVDWMLRTLDRHVVVRFPLWLSSAVVVVLVA